MFSDDFLWENPKNSVFCDMLKFVTNACISDLGLKIQQNKGETMPWEANFFLRTDKDTLETPYLPKSLIGFFDICFRQQ